jgi:hypothetical protein
LSQSIILVHPVRTDAGEVSPMSLTILYQHPQRPDEAGVVLVPDRAKAAEIKDQLENRGFLVIKIVTAPFAKAHHQSD